MIRKGVRRLPIFRYLLGELVYGDGLDISAYLALWELWDWIKRKDDPKFLQAHESKLGQTQKLLRAIGKKGYLFPVRLKLPEDFEKAKSLVPTPETYFGLKGQKEIRQSFRLLLHDERPPQHLPPKRFIGRGYDDEGTYRDLSKDGSPHWSELTCDWKNQGLFPEDECTGGDYLLLREG